MDQKESIIQIKLNFWQSLFFGSVIAIIALVTYNSIRFVQPETLQPNKSEGTAELGFDFSFYDALSVIDVVAESQLPTSVDIDTENLFAIQVGAFQQRVDAEAMLQRLQSFNLTGQIQVSELAGRNIHRVRIGPFTEEEAIQYREILNSIGIYSITIDL